MNDKTIQCSSHVDNNNCPNFISSGYNCDGNDNENRMAPYGHTTQQRFIDIFIKGINGYGPCKCSKTDTDCQCGRINVDGKIFVAEWNDTCGWINWRLDVSSGIKSALKR